MLLQHHASQCREGRDVNNISGGFFGSEPMRLVRGRENCRGVTSLLWNDIELSWKLHLPEHLLRIFTYKNGNVVTFN